MLLLVCSAKVWIEMLGQAVREQRIEHHANDAFPQVGIPRHTCQNAKRKDHLCHAPLGHDPLVLTQQGR
jgi:hypothetical protein